jgi:hypothetical protein
MADCRVKNMLDWARAEILGHLCGQFERSDRVFTRDHEFVLVDNELMWSVRAESPWKCRWLVFKDRTSEAGVRLARELCRQFCDVPNDEIDQIGRPPTDFLDEAHNVDHRDLRKNIRQARQAAREFLDSL